MENVTMNQEAVTVATDAVEEVAQAMPKDKTALVVGGAAVVVLIAAYGVKKLVDHHKAKKAEKEVPATAEAPETKAEEPKAETEAEKK